MTVCQQFDIHNETRMPMSDVVDADAMRTDWTQRQAAAEAATRRSVCSAGVEAGDLDGAWRAVRNDLRAVRDHMRRMRGTGYVANPDCADDEWLIREIYEIELTLDDLNLP